MAMNVSRSGETSVKSSPNVVPMIDIMLVLLIIFMIVTPLIAAGFKATMPKGKNLDQAIALAEKNKKSHVSRVLGEALAEVKPLLRDRATITAADINSAERAVERQMLIVLSEFKRGTGILATVGSTAPFVGLLGTTMGIVNAFTGMAQQGASGGLAGISAGIAEALITTAFGLLVAIPAVWAYNYFTTKIENLSVEMTYTSKELIDYLIKSVGSEFGRSIFTKEFQAQKAVTGSGQISG